MAHETQSMAPAARTDSEAPFPPFPPLPRFRLRYAPLDSQRRAPAFPCDAQGRVDLDALPQRELIDYLFARACVGRDFACPVVERVLH